MDKPEVNILLVEDDDLDAMAIERAIVKQKAPVRFIRLKDGQEALEFLRKGRITTNDVALPYLVLLDLNMPRMGGIEFLQEVRDDACLKDIVIFVLTTSSAEEDLIAAYNKNIAGYIVKGKMQEGANEILEMLNAYWRLIEFPKLPNKSNYSQDEVN